jgi:hypothetical protein
MGDFLLAHPHEVSPCSVFTVIGVASCDQLRVHWLWKDTKLSLIAGLLVVQQLRGHNCKCCNLCQLTLLMKNHLSLLCLEQYLSSLVILLK